MSSVNAPVNVSTSIAGYHPLIIFRYRPLLGNELPLQASVVLRYSSCSLDLEAWTKFELTLRVKVSFCEITARFPAEKLVIVKTPGFCNTGWIFHFGHIWMLCYARFSWITWTDHISSAPFPMLGRLRFRCPMSTQLYKSPIRHRRVSLLKSEFIYSDWNSCHS